MSAPPWVYDDGGRAAAGYRGTAPGDCAVRAAAIASGLPYRQVYDLVNELAQRERTGKRKRGRSHARTGVYSGLMQWLLRDTWHWRWVPTMQIGSGCKVHVRADELPDGPLVLNLSKHYAAWVDGAVRDTHDPSRDGTRCVYGFWWPGPEAVQP
jgi:hypothetical protein